MNEDLQNHIMALKAYAEQTVVEKADVEALEKLKEQIEDIREFVRGWERKGRSVPDSIRDQEAKLVDEIKELTGGSEMGQVYEELLAVVVRLGRRCQRPLQKDLGKAIRAYDRNTTSPEEFQKLIIQFLKERGGSTELQEVTEQIRQCLQAHSFPADWDRLPKKKRYRWEDNVRREIRKMKDKHILTRRGGSKLILASQDADVSQCGQQGSQRLRWERASRREDCFDLRLTNPQALDIDHCRELLEAVEMKDGVHPPHFNTDASKEFQRWLGNLDTSLREQAYARLSNWFLTDKQHCKTSPLAEAAFELWDVLFCAKPDMRLTHPKSDHRILPERFDLWWSRQVDCQNA